MLCTAINTESASTTESGAPSGTRKRRDLKKRLSMNALKGFQVLYHLSTSLLSISLLPYLISLRPFSQSLVSHLVSDAPSLNLSSFLPRLSTSLLSGPYSITLHPSDDYPLCITSLFLSRFYNSYCVFFFTLQPIVNFETISFSHLMSL